LNIFAPCPRGWRSEAEISIQLSRIAVETNYWPLFEIENGTWKINLKPRQKPIEEYLKPQRRFAHLFKPENKWMIEDLQHTVEERWEKLLKKIDNQ
jgi:pyruvate ferredoxin oxidoreductase beta subunit